MKAVMMEFISSFNIILQCILLIPLLCNENSAPRKTSTTKKKARDSFQSYKIVCASKNLERTVKLSKKLSQLYLYTYGKKEYLSFTLPMTKKLSGPWFYTRHGSFVLSPGTDQLLFFPWPQVSEWCLRASLLLLFQNRQLRFHLSLVTSNTNKCQSLWELNNTQNTTYF